MQYQTRESKAMYNSKMSSFRAQLEEEYSAATERLKVTHALPFNMHALYGFLKMKNTVHI